MKNEAKIKGWGLEDKVRFYYLKLGRNENGQATEGVATVCVIGGAKGESAMHPVRGVAFCSPKDQFVKKSGRAIALGRAIKAIETHLCSEPISKSTPAGVLLYSGWGWLSEFNPELTDYETKLFQPRPAGGTKWKRSARIR